jgi:hypothetical protein
MNFNQLVTSVLNENNTAVPIIKPGETMVIYAIWADGSFLGTMDKYSDKNPKDQDILESLIMDVDDLSVDDSSRAWDIFASEIYRAEGALTHSTKAVNNLNKKLTKVLTPYMHIHGQWFAGESCGGPFCMGVKVDLNHPDYRASGLRDVASDIANQTDVQDISDW